MSEGRRNAVVVVITLGVALLLGLFLLRPATILGVDADSLSSSLDGFQSKCRQLPDERWRCFVSSGSEGERLVVETRAFGCWDAWRGRELPRPEQTPDMSGCISGLDVL